MPARDLLYHEMTMRAVFRFLLWLSITLLSLQGGAAMAAHGNGTQALAHAMAAHEQAAVPDHCKQAKQAKGALAKPAHAKCASCASCCAGISAPPAMVPGFHAPALAAPLHARPEAAMTSFIPSTLERPPRGDSA
jgi:hypothetical protein